MAGYRVHTNTWVQTEPQLPLEEVYDVLDRVDQHFDAAMESLRPKED